MSGVTDVRKLVLGNLRSALHILERHPEGQRDDSVAWRVADALLVLKSLNQDVSLPGVDYPTGRGVRLTFPASALGEFDE